jgi:uncharacterized protein YbaR (Trm112 family)
MLSPELLAIIVCPACRNKLDYNEPRQTLTCTSCRRIYPIKDGIPVLLVEEGKIEN